MNANILSEILISNAFLSEKYLDDLDKIIQEFPYFQAPRAVRLKILHNQNNYKYSNELKITAAHTTDRSVLYDLMYQKLEVAEEKLDISEEKLEIRSQKLENVVGNEENVIGNEENVVGNEENVVVIEENVVGNEENVVGNEENVVGNEENVVGNEENVVGNEENVVGNEENVVGNEENVVGNEENVVGNEENVVGNNEENVVGSEENVVVNDEITSYEEDNDLLELLENIKSELDTKSNESSKLKQSILNIVSNAEIEEKQAVVEIIQNNVPNNEVIDNEVQNSKLSFEDWLQLASNKALNTEIAPKIEKKPTKEEVKLDVDNSKNIDSKKRKLEIIDKFIAANPKISPIKIHTSPPVVIQSKTEDNSIMTETLAKIYFEQKKYQKAIQAYEILIMKYPENSFKYKQKITEIKSLEQ